jgi:hypothetical protein
VRNRRYRPKDSPTLPYPKHSVEQREQWDEFLAYFMSVCTTALGKLQQIPKEKRPDWYEKQIQYWKHARSGFKWARGRNRQTIQAMNAVRDASTESIDSVL